MCSVVISNATQQRLRISQGKGCPGTRQDGEQSGTGAVTDAKCARGCRRIISTQ